MDGNPEQPKRVHSVPVPRLYKVAATILKNFEDGKDSLKNLVFNCKKHPNKKGLFSLVMETQNHKKQLDQVTQKIELFVTEPRFNKHLAYVLINELFWGKQALPGDSLPVQTVLKYKKRLKKCIDMDGGVDGRTLCDTWPRYARINTLCINKEMMATQLEEEGWVEVIYEKKALDNKQFLQKISNLKEFQYLSDLHIANLLVFPPKSQLYNHRLVTEGSLMLQDKSSCFPVAALAPPVGSSVLDACAAPGMKTSQLAAAVCGDMFATLCGGQPPEGAKVVAVERSVKRYGLLKEILERSQASLVTEVLNQDFLKLDPNKHPDVEYIVVDPSCSGTGMARRGGGDEEPSNERLESLASVQTSLLLHALTFPSVKRVVYSTCAVSVVENEQVVGRVLEKVAGWEVANIMPAWERRGVGEYGNGSKFVRALAEEDMCNGFFVAVLQRKGCIKAKKRKMVSEDNEELSGEISGENCENVINDQPVEKVKKKKKSKHSLEEEELVDAAHVPDDSNEFISKKKKKKSKDKLNEIDDDEAINVPDTSEEPETRKKKKKKKSKDIELSIADDNDGEISDKKNKKGKKSKEIQEVTEDISGVNEDSEKSRKKKKKKDKRKSNED